MTTPTYGPLTAEFVVSHLGMWGTPNNLRQLALRNLFGKIPNPLSFEQSIIDRLVTDFLESFLAYSSQGCEFQVYLAENPYALTLEDLPPCPIWFELMLFVWAGVAKYPQLRGSFASGIPTVGAFP